MTQEIQSQDHVAASRELITRQINELQPGIALACSFSPEDIVIAHMMVEANPKARIFAIDTGRLNEETYQCADALVRRLEISIEWYFPQHEAIEELVRSKGMFSFYDSLDNRHECCHIRKVEPLTRALSGLKAWVTGMRSEQSVTRAELPKEQTDDAHGGILKLNPLADWTAEQVDAYIKAHNLPRNSLQKKGFLSIGCAPCTRPVAEGQDARSGRWWWENPEHKECGLHTESVTVNLKG
ncbi:phosphoadenosine phosphosulfate reductase [bacterium M21]|nr:phosphoadenosine phosphosulfate reductase [bacterium M21]